MLIAKKRKKASKSNNSNKANKQPRKNKANIKLSILLYSAVIVFMCIYLLSRYAKTTKLQMEVIEKEQKIAELTEEKSKLDLELEEIKDSGWIEEQAKVRMNMRKANKDQIIYLDIK